jgi:hypothetical protein
VAYKNLGSLIYLLNLSLSFLYALRASSMPSLAFSNASLFS